jgi:hypothetical protein
MSKAINWWRKTFPKCELRPSAHVSAVMHGKRFEQWGTGSKVEGPYVLLRSHDGGQDLPLHTLTVCGLFRWNGRKLVPVFVVDGHADQFVEPEDRKAASAHDRRAHSPLGILAIYAGSSGHLSDDEVVRLPKKHKRRRAS